MGKNLEQILAEVSGGDKVSITIVTNQDDGIVSYATGSVIYHPAALIGPFFRPARLSTTGGEPLKSYFGNRMLDIDPPAAPGTFGPSPRQPFSANALDKLGVSISLGLGPRTVKFTLHSWENATFSVSMESRGNLLVGLGAPVGNLTDHAVYVVSFNGVLRPPG
jgi:hypothetical protein